LLFKGEKMKEIINLFFVPFVAFGLLACGEKSNKEEVENLDAKSDEVIQLEKPTDADFLAFMVYHHMDYMKTTAKQAGGTNKLLHTRELPTEGTDPVVTPALDHIYTKAVIDLSEGPVTVSFPNVQEGRYYSIHITDEEHYTIYDEVFPKGSYVFIRKGKDMDVPEGVKVIECDGDYPHLFIRVQVFTNDDLVNVYPIQDKISIEGVSKTLEFDDPIKFTLENRDVYSQNKAMLEASVNFNKGDYLRVSKYIGVNAPRIGAVGNFGKYGPIDSKEKGSNDMENRAGGIVGHLGFPVHHAYYQPYFTNCDDEVLSGDKTEVFTFPYKPEGVELFWSVTRYSALTRNTIAGKNDLFNAYNTKPDENGNITITFSVEDPKDGTYWMPVNAGEPYYFVCRYYKPDINNLPEKPCN
jgi:hypothetical protein